jgi:hypothetical protein
LSLKGEFLGADGRVDVTRVMATLRDPSSPEEVDDRARSRLQAYAEEAAIDPEFLDALRSRKGGWNLLPDYPLVTHRPGPEGWLVLLLKRLLRPVIRPYTDTLFRRQAQINLYLLRLLEAMARDLVRLEDERSREGRKPQNPAP